MTRLWPAGEIIRVTMDENGNPTVFHWAGSAHPVQAIVNRWRLDEHWWDSRVWREYYKLTTETGLLVIVYRDLVSKTWHLLRLYD